MQPKDFHCPDCGKSVAAMNKNFHEATCPAKRSPKDDNRTPLAPAPDRAQNLFGGGQGLTFGQPVSTNRGQQSAPAFQMDDSQDIDRLFHGMFKKPAQPHAYPSVDQKYKKEELPVDPRSQMGYSCPKCTAFVSDRDYTHHLNTCPYTACQFCYDYYPNEFINEHRQICEKNPVNEGGAHPDFHIGVDGQLQLPSTPRQFQASPRGPAPRTPIQSESAEREEDDSPQMDPFGRPIQGAHHRYEHPSPLSDYYQSPSRNARAQNENPFFMFFHGRSGGWDEPVRRGPQPVMMRRVFINGREVDPDNLGGGGSQGAPLEDFFQLFMNHGNFMRQNRFTINGARLADLLEQLSNPNRGVQREDLNRIERKVFQKAKSVKPGEEEKCPICITEFEDGEEIKNLPCNHMFHGNCIDTWLVQNSHCPICKADLLDNGAQD